MRINKYLHIFRGYMLTGAQRRTILPDKAQSICTLHSYRSDGPGGVESLIRFLQTVAIAGPDNRATPTRAIEIFALTHSVSISPLNPHVTHVQIAPPPRLPSVIQAIWRKLRFRRALMSIAESDLDARHVLILMHMTDLLFLPWKAWNYYEIILVQTNRPDVWASDLLLRLTQKKLRRSAALVAYTSFDKTALAQRLVAFDDSRIHVIPRACKLRTAKHPVAPGNRLVTITRIHERQKNLAAMVDVVRQLDDRFTLDIYGSGPPAEVTRLNALISDNRRIRYCGPAYDVEEVLAEYSIFLMTSNYEGFGQSLIEARSQGLPIILFDTFPAARWIVDNGVTGFLVEPGNTAAFREKILQLATDTYLHRQMADNALRRAHETEHSIVAGSWRDLLFNGTSAQARGQDTHNGDFA